MSEQTTLQLYTGDMTGYFSASQLAELDKRLDPRLISQRSSGGSNKVKYIEGHDAIDQANRIFGYGNWSYRPVSIEQVVLYDPLTGEAVGIEYKAVIELTVRGAIGPIVDIGSQPVSTWNVFDQVMQRRTSDAKYNHAPVDESPFTPLETKNARAVIVDAHEAAKKGAVTDGLKRCLRAYGDQFGNGLYGDGHTDLSINEERPANERPRPAQRPPQQPAARPAAIAAPPVASEQQPAHAPSVEVLSRRCTALNRNFPSVIRSVCGQTVDPNQLTGEQRVKIDELLGKWEVMEQEKQAAKQQSAA